MADYKFLYEEKRPDRWGGIEVHKVYDAELKRNAKLHQFKNADGVEYSAIYELSPPFILGYREMACCERENEADMIKWWNEYWNKYWKGEE